MAFSTVIFRSNLAFTILAHKKIGQSALFAAANVVRTQAIKNARRGMTTGDFVTPHLAKNIEMEVLFGGKAIKSKNQISTQPSSGASKGATKGVAFIGTKVKYGAYWEEGHNNLFLNKYIRVPWLTHAFKSTATKQQKEAQVAAQRAAKRFAGQGLERLVGITPIGSLRSTIGA